MKINKRSLKLPEPFAPVYLPFLITPSNKTVASLPSQSPVLTALGIQASGAFRCVLLTRLDVVGQCHLTVIGLN